MTYDPEYDTPSVLYQYGAKHGIDLDDRMLMLRPDPERKRELFEELDLAVSFGRRDVSIHGIQLILLDKQGRYVRTYRTLIWDNANVIEDLKQLAGETWCAELRRNLVVQPSWLPRARRQDLQAGSPHHNV